MYRANEHRKEQRLICNWHIWFAEGFNKTLRHGNIINISSSSVAFTYDDSGKSLDVGQRLFTYLFIPNIGSEDLSNVVALSRGGNVCRIDTLNSSMTCVVIQLDEPLPFKADKLLDTNRMIQARKRFEKVAVRQQQTSTDCILPEKN
ncbi:MAG: hypothetical protein ACYSSI_06595 [Planctomycetota bacterium]|jgi:hypothetical protein